MSVLQKVTKSGFNTFFVLYSFFSSANLGLGSFPLIFDFVIFAVHSRYIYCKQPIYRYYSFTTFLYNNYRSDIASKRNIEIYFLQFSSPAAAHAFRRVASLNLVPVDLLTYSRLVTFHV